MCGHHTQFNRVLGQFREINRKFDCYLMHFKGKFDWLGSNKTKIIKNIHNFSVRK